jgi:hypothetical protein
MQLASAASSILTECMLVLFRALLWAVFSLVSRPNCLGQLQPATDKASSPGRSRGWGRGIELPVPGSWVNQQHRSGKTLLPFSARFDDAQKEILSVFAKFHRMTAVSLIGKFACPRLDSAGVQLRSWGPNFNDSNDAPFCNAVFLAYLPCTTLWRRLYVVRCRLRARAAKSSISLSSCEIFGITFFDLDWSAFQELQVNLCLNTLRIEILGTLREKRPFRDLDPSESAASIVSTSIAFDLSRTEYTSGPKKPSACC